MPKWPKYTANPEKSKNAFPRNFIRYYLCYIIQLMFKQLLIIQKKSDSIYEDK